MAQWIKDQMASNSAAWHTADQNERKRLEAENQKLGSQIGGSYNANSGTWSNSSGGSLYQPKNSNVSSKNNNNTVSLNTEDTWRNNNNNNNSNNSNNSGGYSGAVDRILNKNNNYGFSDDSLSFLQGKGSGRTLNEQQYGDYYTGKISESEKNLEWARSQGGYRDAYAKTLEDTIKSYQTTQQLYNDFADWDSGLADVYIRNKRLAEQSNDPEEKARLAAINSQLRAFYGMEEDNYNWGQMGQLGADILFGDFLNYGLNKEENYQDIPAIGKTSDNYDPKFESARMMARSEGMLGYKPLGYLTGDSAEANRNRNADNIMNSVNLMQSTDGSKDQFGILNQDKQGGSQQNIQISDELTNSLQSSGIKLNGKLEVSSNVMIGQNGESMYKTNQGYFAKASDGTAIKIEEDTYNSMLMKMYGIEPIYNKSLESTSIAKPGTPDSISASGKKKDSQQTIVNKELEANKAKTALENGHITNYGASSPQLNTFIESARSMIDYDYSQEKRMGKNSVDCSSLIGRAMQMAGITNDPFVTTASMVNDDRFVKISKSEIQPGDILWEKGHAGIFLGNNKTLEARYSTKKVGESILGNRFTHAYRIKV